jgi:hypothetical protein
MAGATARTPDAGAVGPRGGRNGLRGRGPRRQPLWPALGKGPGAAARGDKDRIAIVKCLDLTPMLYDLHQCFTTSQSIAPRCPTCTATLKRPASAAPRIPSTSHARSLPRSSPSSRSICLSAVAPPRSGSGAWAENRVTQKMSCPGCGVHIKFLAKRLGERTNCPQCRTAITLRRPENLRMSCFFCQGHIEFPAHAIGNKLQCPHCKNDITLKEPTAA